MANGTNWPTKLKTQKKSLLRFLISFFPDYIYKSKGQMRNKEIDHIRQRIAEKTSFLDWACANNTEITDIIFSTERYCQWDVCFFSGNTKVVCEFKVRESQDPFPSQIIEEIKWDSLTHIHDNRPDVVPIYLVIYNTGKEYVSYEYDLSSIQEPRWEIQQHWSTSEKMSKMTKSVAYLDNKLSSINKY